MPKSVARNVNSKIYQNDLLIGKTSIIVRNGYGASVEIVGGLVMWYHSTSPSYYTDVEYAFNSNTGTVTAKVNVSVGWDESAGYIKDVFYKF